MKKHNRTLAFRKAIPGIGYAIALGFCVIGEGWLVGPWGDIGYEITWFVIAPGLFGLVHLVSPKSLRGGRPFVALGSLWLGAAVLGAISHWRWLGAMGPVLSLLRYMGIAMAGIFFALSVMAGRPLFVTPAADGQRSGFARAAMVVIGMGMLILWAGMIALVAYVTPFSISLAPQEQDIQAQRVWESDWDKYLVWLAWSPDSRYIVGQGKGVWVVSPAQKEAVQVSESGVVFYDRPWGGVDGRIFFAVSDGKDVGMWAVSPDASDARQLVQRRIGLPSCSSDGSWVAYESEEGLCVMRADGTEERVIASAGALPMWSPDGQHLLTVRCTDGVDEVWLVSVGGEECKLPVPAVPMQRMVWIRPDMFATLNVEETAKLPILGVRRKAVVKLWDLDGKCVGEYALGSYLGDRRAQIAAAPDGRRLAVTADMLLPFGSTLAVLDIDTGRWRRLPASVYGSAGMAWSPDCRSLALSDAIEVTHHEKFSCVDVISGFKLFEKEKVW